jgi:hypothetical protein
MEAGARPRFLYTAYRRSGLSASSKSTFSHGEPLGGEFGNAPFCERAQLDSVLLSGLHRNNRGRQSAFLSARVALPFELLARCGRSTCMELLRLVELLDAEQIAELVNCDGNIRYGSTAIAQDEALARRFSYVAGG